MRRYHKNFSCIALIMAAVMFLTGCAGNMPFMRKEEPKEAVFTAQTLGLAPDFSYERKAERPGILVDRLGYLPTSVKTALFQGKELPERFEILEKETGECVYEGEVRPRGDAADNICTGFGSFTDFAEEGNYYIRCDKIGCSYYFVIGEDVYLEQAKELGARIEGLQSGQTESGEEAVVRESMEICETLSYLLVTYEMYPGLLVKMWNAGNKGGEEAQINGEKFFGMLRAETDLLLTIQDEKTGGIYREAKTTFGTEESAQPEISAEATAVYAGTMAKYSYLYQQYDWDYANICLKAAAKAWRYLDNAQRKNEQETAAQGQRFYAASELYRASNEELYHNYMLQNQELLLNGKEDFYRLLGKITYLSTKRTVDHALCGQLMSGLMEEAERIEAETKEGLFLTGSEKTDVILWDMTIMALANYAIMNHEYVTVIENHIHYLLGRNRESVLLTENLQSVEAAKLLLLFGVIEEERRIIGLSEGREQEK